MSTDTGYPFPVRLLGLAFAYLVAAKLSLLLAIPPGFASPVWPAAGIAVACILIGGYRYLPGVFLGSFLANLMVAIETGSDTFSLQSAAVAAGIGAGATLQAAFATYLIRQVVRYPSPLHTEKEIGMLLLMGGAIGSVVNATIGPLTLVAAGAITPGNYLMTWFTWWAGDTIGVILFLPAILILISPEDMTSAKRKLSVVLPVIFITFVVVTFFLYTRQLGEAQARRDFADLATDKARIVQEQFRDYVKILHSIERLYNASDFVSHDEFSRFVSFLHLEHPGIKTLVWAPRVLYKDRLSFEKTAQESGLISFRIYRPPPDAASAHKAPGEYFPVYYQYPYPGIEELTGLDLASNHKLGSALADARDSGEAIATSGLNLGFNKEELPGIAVFVPVYKTEEMVDTTLGRRENLVGFVAGCFQVSEIIRLAMTDLTESGLSLHIFDNYLSGGAAVIYGHPDASAPYSEKILLQAAGRQWTMEFFPLPEYLQKQKDWQSWLVLIGGLFFSTLLQAFLLVVSARREAVNRLVEEQTGEIRRTNLALEDVILRLTESNAELERFAYVASHDLQEPLRKMISFTSMLEQRYSNKLDAKARYYMELITNSSTRMKKLIEDILEYARLGNEAERLEAVDVNLVMRGVIDNLRSSVERSGAEVTWDKLPVIQANPVRILRLLQNLVGNGIKYQYSGNKPVVHVSIGETPDEWIFSVADNGIGVDREYCKKIFEPFERLHGKKEFAGTGLGLSICKKIVEGLGGKIWAEPGKVKGSVFHFTIPRHARENIPGL